MKGVYIVSKGEVSKVGSSFFAEQRSKRVAMELFGSTGCQLKNRSEVGNSSILSKCFNWWPV